MGGREASSRSDADSWLKDSRPLSTPKKNSPRGTPLTLSKKPAVAGEIAAIAKSVVALQTRSKAAIQRLETLKTGVSQK